MQSLFYRKSSGRIILLVIYIDDIFITGSDYVGIFSLKYFLHTSFCTKDLCKVKFILGVEVNRRKKGICLSQRNYILDLLAETVQLAIKPAVLQWFLMCILRKMMVILLMIQKRCLILV